MLDIDLFRLKTPQRFQNLCWRLARREYPGVVATEVSSWDRGADAIALNARRRSRREPTLQFTVTRVDEDARVPEPPPVVTDDGVVIEFGNTDHIKVVGDVIWQCKFSRTLGSATKKAIKESLRAVEAWYQEMSSPLPPELASRYPRVPPRILRWILCVPVDPSGKFVGWLREAIESTTFSRSSGFAMEVWGRSELLARLEVEPDLIETYFYTYYEEVRRYFSNDDLELVHLALDKRCAWGQADPNALVFHSLGNHRSPDLVFDVTLRNPGKVDTILRKLHAYVADWDIKLHGIPDDGLLVPDVVCTVSICDGQPGVYESAIDPFVVVQAGKHRRLTVRVVDTGYAWRGALRLAFSYGNSKELFLPWVRLLT